MIKHYVKIVPVNGRRYYYLRPPKALEKLGLKGIRLDGTEKEAKAAGAKIVRDFSTGPVRHHASVMMANGKKRAGRTSIPFELVHADLIKMMVDQDYRCAVSLIPFDLDHNPTNAFYRPWRPSLDRIDHRGPYTIANCRIVCVIANWAMGQWGEEALLRLAKGVVRRTLPEGELTNPSDKLSPHDLYGFEKANEFKEFW